MAKIRYSDEFICPKCGRHTGLIFRSDLTYQAHCAICHAYYDVEIVKTTNADRIRAMSDDELANFIGTHDCLDCPLNNEDDWCAGPAGSCRGNVLEWLKAPVEEVDE